MSGVIVSGEDSDSAEEAQPVIPPLKGVHVLHILLSSKPLTLIV